MSELISLIDKLNIYHSLSLEEYERLIAGRNDEATAYARTLADRARRDFYGNSVFVRGLIEIGNVCRNDCLYCGIRRSNAACSRYVLTAIRKEYPDCAITLSLGEYSRADYARMREAGADRYLLRHETADKAHYEKLHPSGMSFDNRMRCLRDLKELGFQVGCGFMVGSPFQTAHTLAEDLKFIETFSPDMCGIGPFIPHHETPLGNYPAGSAEETIYLLSIIRLIKPNILLPATTALGTVSPTGREDGILAGANVVMPNLSPVSVRKKYELYENKICTGDESAQSLAHLKARMEAIGFNVVTDRGDIKKI